MKKSLAMIDESDDDEDDVLWAKSTTSNKGVPADILKDENVELKKGSAP